MYLVFSDLDGTLLDHNTYSYEESLAGIGLLKEQGCPLVLVSSKTFEEMKVLHAALALDSPLIFENGSGIAFRSGEKWNIEIFGPGSEKLREYIQCIEDELGSSIELLSDMPVEKIVSLTDLSLDRAELSQKRRGTLPFILKNDTKTSTVDLEKINQKMAQRNIAVTKGGRFYHLIPADSDKGSAVDKIKKIYQSKGLPEVMSVGIGDSENDVSMLKAVDRAFLVRKPDGTSINSGLRRITVTRHPGPAGFTEAVRSLFV